MPRLLRLIALLVVLVLGATACGDGGGGGGDGGDTAAEGDGGGGALEGETIEVAAVWTGTEQENFEKVLTAFEEETGADVTYRSTGDDIATVLGTRIEGGDPPDIAILPQPGLLADLAERDALTPIEDIAGEVVDENYAPVWRELGTVDGELYSVWFKAANKSTVWYSTQALEDAGAEPPETWDDLIEVSQTVADSGVPAFAIAGGDGWTLTDWFENVYLRVAGPEKYDQLARHEIPWTDPTVVESLQELAKLWGEEDLIAPGATSMLFPESVAAVLAEPQKAAMVYEGDFVAGVITDETEAALGEDADFFDFPAVQDSDPAIVGGGDVAVMLTESEAAEELMRFLASPEAAEIWAAEGGFTSPNKNVDTGVYPDEISRRSAEALVEAEIFRFDLSDLQPAAFGALEDHGMRQILQDYLRNPADVDGIARRLEVAAAAAWAAAGPLG